MRRLRPRSYISTTEPLDTVYTPAFPVDVRYEGYYRPTMLTDERGRLAEDLAEDLADAQPP